MCCVLCCCVLCRVALCYVVSCCVVSCRVVLCCVVLCCVVLCCVVLCCVVLWCGVVRCVVLWCDVAFADHSPFYRLQHFEFMGGAFGPLVEPLFFLVFVLAASAQSSGSAGCPCIEPNWDTNGSCLGDWVRGQFYCFPANYGAQVCDTWDLGREPLCNATSDVAPESCSLKWCFVDPGNCDVALKRSPFLAKMAFISYSTCGNNETAPFSGIRGQTIRIAFPDDDPPYIYRSGGAAEGLIHDSTGEWVTGSVVQLALAIFADLGLNYTVRGIAPYSLRLYPQSSYTACIHAISMGLLDMCVGAHWVTAERTAMVPFAPSIHPDILAIFLMDNAQSESFADLAARIFKPFTLGLWLTIIGVAIFLGLLVYISDMQPNETWYKALGHSLWVSTASMLITPDYYEYESRAGRGRKLLSAAYGVFVLIVMATYTANLASFLYIEKTVDAGLESLAQLVALRKEVCILEAISGELRSSTPALEPFFVTVDGLDMMLESIASGVCHSAIYGFGSLTRVMAGHSVLGLEGCALVSSTMNDRSVPLAFPVSDEYHTAVSHAQRKILERESWKNIHEAWLEPALCEPPNEDGREGSLDVKSMLGLWLLLGGLVFLWVLDMAFLFATGRRRLRTRQGRPYRHARNVGDTEMMQQLMNGDSQVACVLGSRQDPNGNSDSTFMSSWQGAGADSAADAQLDTRQRAQMHDRSAVASPCVHEVEGAPRINHELGSRRSKEFSAPWPSPRSSMATPQRLRDGAL